MSEESSSSAEAPSVQAPTIESPSMQSSGIEAPAGSAVSGAVTSTGVFEGTERVLSAADYEETSGNSGPHNLIEQVIDYVLPFPDISPEHIISSLAQMGADGARNTFLAAAEGVRYEAGKLFQGTPKPKAQDKNPQRS